MKQEERINKHKNNPLLRLVDEVRMEPVHDEEYFEKIKGESALTDRFKSTQSLFAGRIFSRRCFYEKKSFRSREVKGPPRHYEIGYIPQTLT